MRIKPVVTQAEYLQERFQQAGVTEEEQRNIVRNLTTHWSVMKLENEIAPSLESFLEFYPEYQLEKNYDVIETEIRHVTELWRG